MEFEWRGCRHNDVSVRQGSHHEISQLSSQDVADPMITVHEVNSVGAMAEPGVDGGGGDEVADSGKPVRQ